MNSVIIDSEKCRKVLYEISKGSNLTKLDIKNGTGFSMSTVISAVDELNKLGLIDYVTEKRENGGKPASVININCHKFIVGVSYKSGALAGVAINLKGQTVAERQGAITEKGIPPEALFGNFVGQLCTDASCFGATEMVGTAVAVNCRDEARLKEELQRRFNVCCRITSNMESAGQLRVWQGAKSVVALSVGARVRCACLGNGGRMIDVGDLPAPVYGKGGRFTYGEVLSYGEVGERLNKGNYKGAFMYESGEMAECRDVGEYSAMIAETLASLCTVVDVMVAPQEIVLFGDYITKNFFEKVRCRADKVNAKLVYADACRQRFALGAALVGLNQLYSQSA